MGSKGYEEIGLARGTHQSIRVLLYITQTVTRRRHVLHIQTDNRVTRSNLVGYHLVGNKIC